MLYLRFCQITLLPTHHTKGNIDSRCIANPGAKGVGTVSRLTCATMNELTIYSDLVLELLLTGGLINTNPAIVNCFDSFTCQKKPYLKNHV